MSHSQHKDVLLNLLDTYRDMPHLWQKDHKDYLNKSLRDEGFRVLLEIYKVVDKSATVKTLKKKLLNMRNNYKKELMKMTSTRKPDASSDEIYPYDYIPTLWYFDALSFIGPNSELYSVPSETTESGEGPISSDDDNSNQQSEFVASTSWGHPSRKRKETLLLKQEKKFKPAAETILSDKREEDWEVFGKSIGLQLKDLNKTQLVFTQKIISDVIYNAKLGRLSEDSCLLVAPSADQDQS